MTRFEQQKFLCQTTVTGETGFRGPVERELGFLCENCKAAGYTVARGYWRTTSRRRWTRRRARSLEISLDTRALCFQNLP